MKSILVWHFECLCSRNIAPSVCLNINQQMLQYQQVKTLRRKNNENRNLTNEDYETFKDIRHFKDVSTSMYGPLLKIEENYSKTNVENEVSAMYPAEFTTKEKGLKTSIDDAEFGPVVKEKYFNNDLKKKSGDHVQQHTNDLSNSAMYKNTCNITTPKNTTNQIEGSNYKKKDLSMNNILKQLKVIEKYPLSNESLNNGCRKIEPIAKYLSSAMKPPSVSTVLKETMSTASKIALKRWEKKKIAELGEAGFQLYKQNLFSTGSNFHACVAAKLQMEKDIDILPANAGVWESIQPAFKDITDVKTIEQKVTHPDLGYLGILDCVVKFRGELVVIDWKTAERRKSTLEAAYDDPVQIMAYIGALNAEQQHNIQINKGLLVVAYRDGHPADILPMNEIVARAYWYKWLTRLHKFWTLKLCNV